MSRKETLIRRVEEVMRAPEEVMRRVEEADKKLEEVMRRVEQADKKLEEAMRLGEEVVHAEERSNTGAEGVSRTTLQAVS